MFLKIKKEGHKPRWLNIHHVFALDVGSREKGSSTPSKRIYEYYVIALLNDLTTLCISSCFDKEELAIEEMNKIAKKMNKKIKK